jgi:hypothetical protein
VEPLFNHRLFGNASLVPYINFFEYLGDHGYYTAAKELNVDAPWCCEEYVFVRPDSRVKALDEADLVCLAG